MHSMSAARPQPGSRHGGVVEVGSSQISHRFRAKSEQLKRFEVVHERKREQLERF